MQDSMDQETGLLYSILPQPWTEGPQHVTHLLKTQLTENPNECTQVPMH